MKKFIITQDMLGRKEVFSILTTPIPENIINSLKAEIVEEERLEQPIQHFLMDFSIVSTMLKKDKTDKLTSVHVEMAIANGQQLPQRIQRLIGPQIYALMEISPRLSILSEVKRYLDTSVIGYMWSRSRGYQHSVIKDTACMLDAMDTAKETINDADSRDVACILRTALRDNTTPLYHDNRSFWGHREPRLNEQDRFAREAFDTILNDGTKAWSFFEPGDIMRLLERAKELGYDDSEVWALKVLNIRKICDLIHWQVLADIKIDFAERIDLLKYAHELGEEVLNYSSREENKHEYHIAWQIMHLLIVADNEMQHACEKNEFATEYFNRKKAEIITHAEN